MAHAAQRKHQQSSRGGEQVSISRPPRAITSATGSSTNVNTGRVRQSAAVARSPRITIPPYRSRHARWNVTTWVWKARRADVVWHAARGLRPNLVDLAHSWEVSHQSLKCLHVLAASNDSVVLIMRAHRKNAIARAARVAIIAVLALLWPTAGRVGADQTRCPSDEGVEIATPLAMRVCTGSATATIVTLERPQRGARVIALDADGVGALAGIAPGDVIYQVAGRRVESGTAAAAALQAGSSQRALLINIWRDGKPFLIRVWIDAALRRDDRHWGAAIDVMGGMRHQ